MKKKKTDAAGKTWGQRFVKNFKKSWMLHLMMILPMTYTIIFGYGPMFGLQIAFKDYIPGASIIKSPWVGLYWFKKFFSNYRWKMYVWNTVRISLYSMAVGFPIPIFLALMFHVNDHKVLKKVTQNVSYVPHFISTVVLVGILNQIFNPFSGIWSVIQQVFNLNITSDIRSNPDAFIHMYIWSGVWQGMGWGTIIYTAALAAVPDELHEAARLDGASRWKRVLHVDLPTIAPTIAILFILQFGNVMNVGYEKAYLMQNSLNINESEIISTYVYKYGIGKSDLSYGTAVGLMNTIINTVLIFTVNKITRKMTDNEVGLF